MDKENINEQSRQQHYEHSLLHAKSFVMELHITLF